MRLLAAATLLHDRLRAELTARSLSEGLLASAAQLLVSLVFLVEVGDHLLEFLHGLMVGGTCLRAGARGRKSGRLARQDAVR